MNTVGKPLCQISISTRSPLVFVAFVLPMWIVFPLRLAVAEFQGALLPRTRKLLTDLWGCGAGGMEERLDNLERVLGPEQPRKTL